MNRPAAVEIAYECMRFLITHNPTNATLNKFTEVRPRVYFCIRVCPFCMSSTSHCLSRDVFQELKKFEVNTLVRVCDATYDKAPVEKEGIQILVRDDGHVHFCCSLFLGFSYSFQSTTLSCFLLCRTGPSTMVPLPPLRLWTTGSSWWTPSFERSLAAALLCTVWQGLAGEWLAVFLSRGVTNPPLSSAIYPTNNNFESL